MMCLQWCGDRGLFSVCTQWGGADFCPEYLQLQSEFMWELRHTDLCFWGRYTSCSRDGRTQIFVSKTIASLVLCVIETDHVIHTCAQTQKDEHDVAPKKLSNCLKKFPYKQVRIRKISRDSSNLCPPCHHWSLFCSFLHFGRTDQRSHPLIE